MRPGLPWRWFDVCVVPRHDHPPAATNVFTSEGVLNPMRAAASRDDSLAMILLGGPSAHHAWNTTAVVAQIKHLTGRAPNLRWVVTDSRRSPPDLASALRGLTAAGVEYMPAADCPPEWLSEQLSRAGQAWVSADSVAMIFEALSAGARVGLIELETRHADRITAIGPDLRARGWVGSCAEDKPLPNPVELNEADRCAQWLLDQFALPESGGRVSV